MCFIATRTYTATAAGNSTRNYDILRCRRWALFVICRTLLLPISSEPQKMGIDHRMRSFWAIPSSHSSLCLSREHDEEESQRGEGSQSFAPPALETRFPSFSSRFSFARKKERIRWEKERGFGGALYRLNTLSETPSQRRFQRIYRFMLLSEK